MGKDVKTESVRIEKDVLDILRKVHTKTDISIQRLIRKAVLKMYRKNVA